MDHLNDASRVQGKNYTRLGRLSRGKHSSLALMVVNYGLKKFYNIGLGSANFTKLEFMSVKYL